MNHDMNDVDDLQKNGLAYKVRSRWSIIQSFLAEGYNWLNIFSFKYLVSFITWKNVVIHEDHPVQRVLNKGLQSQSFFTKDW